LRGVSRDIQVYIKRLAKELRSCNAQVADTLIQLLHELPTREMPFRNATSAALPTDKDSRLQLIRLENPVILETSPILPDETLNVLNQVVAERGFKFDLLRAGIPPLKSLLFTGDPGLGKTLTARWLANQLNLPLLVLDLSAVMSSYLGRTGTNLRNVFDYAKGVPCILFLDELDAIAKKRDDTSEVGELKRLVTVLLQEIDNWDDSGILIAATNHANLLDPAIWRRFDITIEFKMPSSKERSRAIEQFLSDSFAELAELPQILSVIFDGKSYSDIEREINRLRRQEIVSKNDKRTLIYEFIQGYLHTKKPQERIDVALKLIASGHSQRSASDITGVSRDTIRKKTNSDQ
jgi:SpoVK/Ycf46/Vps4 family AAA+-type ATPase